jgi:hypothetical protein
VDEHPQALTAWDAWADVRQDAMADEVHPERHPPWADGAEKSAGRELDARERVARRQSERRVAPAVELAVLALYKPDVVRFEERSCAVLEVEE